MSNYLTNIAAKTVGKVSSTRPRIQSIFAPVSSGQLDSSFSSVSVTAAYRRDGGVENGDEIMLPSDEQAMSRLQSVPGSDEKLASIESTNTPDKLLQRPAISVAHNLSGSVFTGGKLTENAEQSTDAEVFQPAIPPQYSQAIVNRKESPKILGSVAANHSWSKDSLLPSKTADQSDNRIRASLSQQSVEEINHESAKPSQFDHSNLSVPLPLIDDTIGTHTGYRQSDRHRVKTPSMAEEALETFFGAQTQATGRSGIASERSQPHEVPPPAEHDDGHTPTERDFTVSRHDSDANPGQQHLQPRHLQAAKPVNSQPIIQVNIGRIEVRANITAPTPKPARPQRHPATTSLSQYLSDRSKGATS